MKRKLLKILGGFIISVSVFINLACPGGSTSNSTPTPTATPPDIPRGCPSGTKACGDACIPKENPCGGK